MTRRRRVLLIAAAAFAALVVWAVLPPSEAPFREYVAQLRAAGEPVTVAEFMGPNPGPGDNAADDVIDTRARESAIEATGVALPWRSATASPWFESMTPTQSNELAGWLWTLDAHFAVLDRASRRGQLWKPLPPGDALVEAAGFGGLSSGTDEIVTGLRSAHVLLVARAVAAATPEERVGAMATALRLSRLADRTVMRTLVGAAMAGGACGCIRREVETDSAAATLVRNRVDRLLTAERLPALAEIARAKRVAFVELCAGVLDGALPVSNHAVVLLNRDGSSSSVVRRIDGLIWNGGTSVGSPEDLTEACRFLDDVAAIALANASSYPALRRALLRRCTALPRHAAAQVHALVLPRIAETLARVDAACRLTRIALAAAEHRATHGEFPASFDELKPMFPDGVPLDPFTDAAFVCSKTATGVRIASAGRLADDPPIDEATLREKCLVWELKR